MSKVFTASLLIKEKGTINRVRLRSTRLSENAVNELQRLFVEEMIVDPSCLAREELVEGIAEAQQSLSKDYVPEHNGKTKISTFPMTKPVTRGDL